MTELHFSEVTSFKIGTLVDNQTTILSYQKQEVGLFIRLCAIHFLESVQLWSFFFGFLIIRACNIFVSCSYM